MLELSADTLTEKQSSNAYWSVMEYQIKPYKNSKGQVRRITFRPEISPEFQSFFAKYSDFHDEKFTGDNYGKFELSVKGVSKGSFAYTALGVYDTYGKRVGSVPMPFFVPE